MAILRCDTVFPRLRNWCTAARGRLSFPLLMAMAASLCVSMLCSGQPILGGEPTLGGEPILGSAPLSRWQFFQEVKLPEDIPAGCKWVDFVLQPSVFDGARGDLADLRLYDATGKEIPYALRVLCPEDRQQPIPAREFNRLTDRPEEHEVSLELEVPDPEHNMVRLNLGGVDFRRQVTVEGSDDRQQWRVLARSFVMRFNIDGQFVEKKTVSYPPSRLRYLRVRVQRDQYDEDDTPGLALGTVEVLHLVKLPGEIVMWDTSLDQREPIRHHRGPASAWIIDLGGKNIPCQLLELTIDDREFVRDYEVQTWNPRPYGEQFATFHAGTMHRKAGQAVAPVVVEFSVLPAERLRLVVIDHGNPPLKLQRVRYGAPARQVVFAWSKDLAQPLRLYYGNPQADAPYYDFARNLPTDLEPTPARAALAQREDNPDYVPPQLPLTERLPWLIYVVLGSVSVLLAGLIVVVGRRAIVLHDAQAADPPDA